MASPKLASTQDGFAILPGGLQVRAMYSLSKNGVFRRQVQSARTQALYDMAVAPAYSARLFFGPAGLVPHAEQSDATQLREGVDFVTYHGFDLLCFPRGSDTELAEQIDTLRMGDIVEAMGYLEFRSLSAGSRPTLQFAPVSILRVWDRDELEGV